MGVRPRSVALGVVVLFILITGINVAQDRRSAVLAPDSDRFPVYSGAVHVHSVHSDGSGTLEEIGNAAVASELDFVLLTDHSTVAGASNGGEGYYGSALVMVGEEINTSYGHVLALGTTRHLEQDGPDGFPGLLNAIRSDGGISVVAHPYGRRAWQEWGFTGMQGLEVFNADSEWRNDNLWEWTRALVWYPLFPVAALNGLVDYPAENVGRLDKMAASGHVVGVASVDAHARIPLWGDQFLPFPAYERMFNWFRTYVLTDEPLTGIAEHDKRAINAAIAQGRSFSVVEGYGAGHGFSFVYADDDTTVTMGGSTSKKSDGRFTVSTGVQGGVVIRLMQDGGFAAESHADEATFEVDESGVYRVEVFQIRRYLPLFDVSERPWIISNPIWIR